MRGRKVEAPEQPKTQKLYKKRLKRSGSRTSAMKAFRDPEFVCESQKPEGTNVKRIAKETRRSRPGRQHRSNRARIVKRENVKR
jgi:hypothetical protein